LRLKNANSIELKVENNNSLKKIKIKKRDLK